MKWGELRRPGADGGIAQLVEHYAGSVRVRSSSLLASTKERSFLRAFFFSPRCAAHWPMLTATTSPWALLIALYG
jgi:hypothetical protein